MQNIKANWRFQKEQKAIRIIYFSLLVIACANAFLSGFITTTYIRLVELISLITIIFYELYLWKMGSLQLSKGISKLLYLLLFTILGYIIIRGDWNLDAKHFMLKLLSHDSLAYLLPFLIIPLPNSRHLKTITDTLFIGAALSIPLWLLNTGNLVQDDYKGESVGAYMPLFAAFLLGFPMIGNKKRKICFLIWAMYLILMLLNARRNMVFSLSCLGLIALYTCNLSHFAKKRSQVSLLVIISVFLVGLFFVSNNYVLSNKIFGRFNERLTEDSRSGVEELFLADFATSPTSDWIWGRGIDGGYYQEMYDQDTGEKDTNRLGIETGYLNNILKGGFVYSIIIVSIMFVGFIRSLKIKNLYSVYFRWLFLLFFIDLYATTLMGTFGPKAIIFWLSVSMTLSKDYYFLGRSSISVSQSGGKQR